MSIKSISVRLLCTGRASIHAMHGKLMTICNLLIRFSGVRVEEAAEIVGGFGVVVQDQGGLHRYMRQPGRHNLGGLRGLTTRLQVQFKHASICP